MSLDSHMKIALVSVVIYMAILHTPKILQVILRTLGPLEPRLRNTDLHHLQDDDDKPKSNDTSVFENGFVSEEEFEQLDGLSISEMKKLKNKNKNKI